MDDKVLDANLKALDQSLRKDAVAFVEQVEAQRQGRAISLWAKANALMQHFAFQSAVIKNETGVAVPIIPFGNTSVNVNEQKVVSGIGKLLTGGIVGASLVSGGLGLAALLGCFNSPATTEPVAPYEVPIEIDYESSQEAEQSHGSSVGPARVEPVENPQPSTEPG